ncbi:Longin-like domain-containing protein [Thamnocephalis sphaerospora]|uniref:Protein transport protein SEC22 n=1 Tax=Thamnocephalis sphaerospora TaxID=78915 RepID=A0A4P9XL99_9FUNG|nr:Longin-like domain-containing protein [Thamnocephalis sphaerospora]|eukprot:RKP06572.1 Longin-like domain-containing protein [Thamnocephalis sphaerospora]
MVRTTIVARVVDALPLAASVDDEQSETELTEAKSQAKILFRKLTPNSEPRCSVEADRYTFHYIIENGVCYLCVCDRSYPRKLAFSYLEELSKEFDVSYGAEAQKQGLRPYAFIKFDTFMQKTKRLYQDTRAQSNLTKLNEDLQDVHRIMTKNMEDLLWRGDSLDRMSTMSSTLRDQSAQYRRDAKRLNLEMLYRKYGLPVVVVLAMCLVLYLRYYWF